MASDLVRQADDAASSALAELPADWWTVLRGVAVPERRTLVDYVVIGPPGVFAVVTVKPARAGIRDRDVLQALDAAGAVAQLSSVVPATYVHPVLCLMSAEPVDGWVNGVVTCSPMTMVELVSARRRVLSADEVRDAALELDAVTARPTRTGRHRRAVRR